MICPCNSFKRYEECCALVHKSIYEAKKAEQLMRSRYTAFVYDNMDYLRMSHAKSTVSSFDFKSVSKWTKTVNWLKLEILKVEGGNESADKGYVEFKAYFLEKGKTDFIHGRSSFIKQDNHWVYLDEL